MTPERWSEMERLYHLAREHGPAVLSGSDPDLRREVEKLLAQDASGQILDQVPGDVLAEMTFNRGDAGEAVNREGQTISHYEVRERLGAGGMGVVYRAFDTKLQRMVALKFLPHAYRDDPELKRLLMEEARAASSLDHPNIVVVHEIGEAGEDLFLAMAFHEGVTLRARMDGTPIPVKEALLAARQIVAGLARAHEYGILHRDIKPSNVVVAKDGVVRIIDFGLARPAAAGVAEESPEEGIRGTPLYMSPEQVAGKAVDSRTDIWSLGVVLYEMLAGAPPFQRATLPEVVRAITRDHAPELRKVRPDVPAEVETIVGRAMEKDPGKRYESAAAMADDIDSALAALNGESTGASLRVRAAYVLAVILLVAVAGATIWMYKASQRQLWVREEAIPQIGRLRESDRTVSAYRLLQKAEEILPGDPELVRLRDLVSHEVSIQTSPPGAAVEVQDYVSPGGEWVSLGVTPLRQVRMPLGYLRWRVSKKGLPVYEGAPISAGMFGPFREYEFQLDQSPQPPEGMVAVPATKYEDYIFSLGALGPFDLPAYFIDRLEVTNREYQRFVDAGGYQKPAYWKNRFVREGRELSWNEAAALLVDTTGKPGPSTWKDGRYPEGQADYPVAGVSWYEAAAYAEYAGKSLPVVAQWYRAAPSGVAKYVVAMSNFSPALAPAGRFQGIGPWGTYDMGGNVAEWCWNSGGGGTRFLLGGAFHTPAAEYFEPAVIPSFHRGAGAGFRCVRNLSALPEEALGERRQTIQDFSKAQPASDAVFRIYKTLYDYDRTPLRAQQEVTKQDSTAWRREKVTLDAAYGKERLPVYLFLPAARGRAPYQTVVYFPTARATTPSSSDSLADMHLIDFVIQSGRAVVYPVYKGTYDRPAPLASADSVSGRETIIQDSKDLGRTLDYLQTRPDIDSSRAAYMGTSMGAAVGVILTGLEPRFRTVIFLDGGFYFEKPLPGANQADFAPRIKVPMLLISGKFDWIFYGKSALLQLIGTSPQDKKAVTFNTSHDVSEQRDDLIREVVSWLDRYLGPVQN